MSKKQWKAGVIVALSLVFVAWSFWPAQAGSSTKGNSADKMSQNIDFATSPDDAAVDITDVMMSGFVFDDASTDTVDEGDSGYARISGDRRILVDADSTVGAVIPGTGATNLGKAEEGTHASGDVGVLLLSVRDDTAPTATAANGKYAALLTNATGNLYVADETLATAVTLTNTSIGPTTATKADIDGVGSVNAHLRRVTTDLGASLVLFGTIDGDTSTIKTNTDPLVTAGGGGYVRQDSTATMAKETGGVLEDSRNLDRNEAIATTGETLDLDFSDVDTVTGLTAGATYMVVSVDGVGLFGVASVGAGGVTTANVLWVVTAGNTVYITMPDGQTTLHYSALTEDVTAYISQVVND